MGLERRGAKQSAGVGDRSSGRWGLNEFCRGQFGVGGWRRAMEWLIGWLVGR